MLRKKYLFLFVAIGIIVLVALIKVCFFSPRPIIRDVETSQIIRMQYNPYVNSLIDGRIEVTEYDEKGILTYLSHCKERRTLDRAISGYWIGDVTLEITIATEDGIKNVILGNDNYSYRSYGKPIYEILEADIVLTELLDMIQVHVSTDQIAQ